MGDLFTLALFLALQYLLLMIVLVLSMLALPYSFIVPCIGRSRRHCQWRSQEKIFTEAMFIH